MSAQAASIAGVRVVSNFRGMVPGSYAGAGSTVIVFTPTQQLIVGELISITVTTRATSQAGVPVDATSKYGFTVAARGGSGLFPFPPDVALASKTRSIAVADLDGDGYPDLLSANATAANAGSVNARLSNGTGGYRISTDIALSGIPLQVVVGDVNLDGHPDFVALLNSNTVSVRLGSGTGSFNAVPDVSVGTGARQAILKDVNQDGRLDLLTVSQSANAVSLRLGNGQGGFALPVLPLLAEVPVGASPLVLEVGDVNRDGRTDLITVSNTTGLTVRLGDGQGAFSGTGTTVFSGYPNAVLLRDVNRDGIPDLLIPHTETSGRVRGHVSIRLGNGSGQFTGTADVLVDTYPGAILVEDLNQDGNVDLVTSNHSDSGDSRTVSVRFGDGLGQFAGITDFTLGTSPNDVVAPIALADVNADGQLDLLSVSRGFTAAGVATSTMNASVRFGDGRGSFSGPTEVEASPGQVYPNGDVAQMVAGDVNRDGIMDFLTSNGQSNSISTRIGNGRGGFSALPDIILPANTHQNEIVLGDINNDGFLDIVAASALARSLYVCFGNGTGSFTAPAPQSINNDTPYAVYLSDVNNDGNLDLLTPTFYSYKILVRLGDGQGNFTGNQEVYVGSNDLRLAIADFNNDGFVDIVAADAYGNNLFRRFGDGTGNFSGTNVTALSVSPTSIATGDVNNDGNLDFVVTLFAGSLTTTCYRRVYLGNGQGIFTPLPQVAITANGIIGTLADVTGDGNVDFIVGNNNSLSLYVGDGTGNFAFTGITPTSSSLTTVIPCDLDKDGDIDLLASCYFDATISVRLNGGNYAIPLATTQPSATTTAHLTVAPNPVRDHAQLLNAPQKCALLVDLMGRSVRTYSNSALALDFTGLTPGIYLLRCGTQTTRVVVE